MIPVNFENLNLKNDELICVITNGGTRLYGEYKGGYIRSSLTFVFLNNNGRNSEKISLSNIQNVERQRN